MNHHDCIWSSTVLETLSVGRGECDFNGFWEQPGLRFTINEREGR